MPDARCAVCQVAISAVRNLKTAAYTWTLRKMLDENRENEFHIIVNQQKLEELCFKDGNTYVMMPLFGPTSYGVEFVEELKTLGAVETVCQKWPVVPYTVAVRNRSNRSNFATLFVDGQKIAEALVLPNNSHTFEGVPTDEGIQELLFSLPRYSTLREKNSAKGRSMPQSKVSELGTIKIVWREGKNTGETHYRNDYRTYSTTSLQQANKSDALDTGVAARAGLAAVGVADGQESVASTTRMGKVVARDEPKACTVWQYQYVGEPSSARILYRTMEYLQAIGILKQEDNETPEETAQRLAKKARKKRKRRAEQAAREGTGLEPEGVPVSSVEQKVPPVEPSGKAPPVQSSSQISSKQVAPNDGPPPVPAPVESKPSFLPVGGNP